MGYRLTDAASARTLLRRMKNPVPEGLVGILAPESGNWWVVLAFSDIGYLKNAGRERIHEAAVLKSLWEKVKLQNIDRKKQGLAPITTVNWDTPPVFDEKDSSLEWAVQAETESGKVINHTLRLLGRYGILDATAVQASTNAIPLKQILKSVSFKQGQRYADYQTGDKVSAVGLVELIINSDAKPGDTRQTVATSGGSTVLWIGSAVVGCAIVTTGILLFNRKRHGRKRHRNLRAGAARAGVAMSPGAKDSVAVGLNGEGDNAAEGSNNHRALHRRRGFNYQKFYSDMILQVSSRSSKSDGLVLNGKSRRGPEAPATPRYDTVVPNQSTVTVNAELISNQKNFIEEQRRLMQQQTKLIEEKSKLIEEKNQLLARQSEMIESNLL
jgi:hypothetical protein